MFAGDGLRDLDLFPKDCFVLELFDKGIRCLRGVDCRLRRLARCYKDDDIVIAFCERNASGRGVRCPIDDDSRRDDDRRRPIR